MKYISIIIAFLLTFIIHHQFIEKPLHLKIDSLTQANFQLQWQIDSIVIQKYELATNFAQVLLLPQNKEIKDSIVYIIHKELIRKKE